MTAVPGVLKCGSPPLIGRASAAVRLFSSLSRQLYNGNTKDILEGEAYAFHLIRYWARPASLSVPFLFIPKYDTM